MTLRHALLVVLFTVSSFEVVLPCAGATPAPPASPAARSRPANQKQRGPKKPAKKPKPKEFPPPGGGNGGGGDAGGGTATGGNTTNNKFRRRRRRRRGRGRRGRRANRPRAPRAGRKKAGPRKPKARVQARQPSTAVEEPSPLWLPWPEQELGEPGSIPPQPSDVLRDDAPVHADTRGRAPRRLLALDGHPGGGFAATWIDARDVEPHVYLGRFDAEGSSLEPERPVALEGRSFAVRDAGLSMGPGGMGALFWTPDAQDASSCRVRTFATDGTLLAADEDARAADRPSEPVAPLSSASSATLLLQCPDGSAVLISEQAGIVRSTRLDRLGRPVGPPETLSPDHLVATGPPVAACEPNGALVVLWPTGRGLAAWREGSSARPARRGAIGLRGQPLDFACIADEGATVSDGAWLLLQEADALRLVRLDDALQPDLAPVTIQRGPYGHAELAVWAQGPAVLVEELVSDASRDLRLYLLRSDGSVASDPIGVLPPGVDALPGAHLASTGDRLMVAWTDTRDGTTDLYGRVFHVEGGLASAERRLTTDEPSAIQDQPSVASNDARTSAVMVWSDRRLGTARVFARRAQRDGSLSSEELRIPAPWPDRSSTASEDLAGERPAVAVDALGRFLVAWKESDGDRDRCVVRAQAFGAGDEPLGPPVVLDSAGSTSSSELTPAVVALRDGSGWAVLSDRREGGVQLVHLTSGGRWVQRYGEAWTAAPVASLALQALDDGRLIATWAGSVDERLRLRGRLVTVDAVTPGLAVDFDVVADFAGDVALAPAQDGGFALAWTRGDESARDVVLCFFDRFGLPATLPLEITPRHGAQRRPALARLADHSWVVAWQDDLSGTDAVHARRVRLAPLDVGPTVAVNRPAPARYEARRSPAIAALGSGFLATWTDARRSLGTDVFARVLGPRFDELDEAPSASARN